MAIGITLTRIMPMVTRKKFFWITSQVPSQYPATRKRVTQTIPPRMLYNQNFKKFILPIPATNGAKVRTMGMNLARMMVLEEMIPIEPSRSVAPENPRANLVAYPIVNRISHDCCDGQQGNHDPELEGAIGDGAQRTHREQEGVSGQERKDHQACFAENDRKEDHVQPLSPDRLHQFAEVAVHMKDPFEELAHGFSWLFRAS